MAANQQDRSQGKKFERQSSFPDQTIPFLLMNDPIFKKITEVQAGRIKQTYDSFHGFRQFNKRFLIPPMFEKYPESSTAQQYLKAFYHFFDGWSMLQNYQKDTIETEDDCDQLKLAFSSYAFGEMYMQHLFSQFFPPKQTSKLIKEYLLWRPDDTIAMFVQVIFKFNCAVSLVNVDSSNYEFQKAIIIEEEEFVHTILSQTDLSDLDKCMLSHIYGQLGAMYTTTHQSRRALDSFQKCYDIDPANVEALYGIAFHHTKKAEDFDEAVKLLKKYIAVSPICEKHYPNAFYLLALLYFTHGKTQQEAWKYCNLAEEAEKQRLDFLYPVDTDAKKMVQMFKLAMTREKTH